MIQAITATNLTVVIQTEDNRIDTSVASTNIRHLIKFTNDMDKSVQYAYGSTESIFERYTKIKFVYNVAKDVYTGKIDLLPAGYWKYEAYEVSWIGAVSLTLETAPVTENDVLIPTANTKGIVNGLVTKGKMYVSEKTGTEEVQYTQNAKSVQTLTIINGGTGYVSAPTITITGSNITQATATCTIDALGRVNSVTITNAGSGYTENPSVVLSGAATRTASIIADINQTNYIYTG